MPALTITYAFNLPVVGADDDLWGGYLNDNWTALDLLLTSGTIAGNAATATAWATGRTLTVGATGKTLDGTADVAFTAGEIGIAKADVGLGSVDDVAAADLRDRATHTGTQAPSTVAMTAPGLVGRSAAGAGAAAEITATAPFTLTGGAASVELAALTEETTPADADLLLLEKGTGGAKRKVTAADLIHPRGSTDYIPTTSGTAFDVTDIPEWANEISVQFWGITWSASGQAGVRLGHGETVIATGYASSVAWVGGSGGGQGGKNETGFLIRQSGTGTEAHGFMLLRKGPGNRWASSLMMSEGGASGHGGGGQIALASPLTRIRLYGPSAFSGGGFSVEWSA